MEETANDVFNTFSYAQKMLAQKIIGKVIDRNGNSVSSTTYDREVFASLTAKQKLTLYAMVGWTLLNK